MRVSHVQFQVWRAVSRGAGSASLEAQRRRAILQGVTALAMQRVPVKDACPQLGISRATFYRWAARLERGSVEALEPSPRRPKRPRVAPVRRAIAESVEELRRDRSDGKEKLVVLLGRRGQLASASTVGRCLRELFDRGVIDRYVPAGRVRPWKPKPPRPYAVRTPKNLRSTSAGEVVQVDTLFVEWGNCSWRQFSSIDLHSRHAAALLGERARASDAHAFLEHLIESSPFPIKAIQVDQGTEFKDVFEYRCRELGIVLYENNARTPQQNAFVERLQRTFRDEFYLRAALTFDMDEINQALQEYLHYYNHERPHAGLNYQTPADYLGITETPLLSHKT